MNEVAELQGEALPETTGEGVELEESPTSEVEETTQEDTPADDRPKAKGVQKRIDELTSNWRTAERDRDYWRELALKSAQPEPKPVEQPASTGKPALDQYESYDEYVEALADWKYEQRALQERERSQKQQQEQTQAEKVRSFQARADAVRETHPDFDQVVTNPTLPISQAMADAAYASEKGPEILYHLGQNPQEADRIYRMSPIEAAMAIGRIEATLSRPARTKSSAPEPIEPVSGVGGVQSVDPDRMTMEQYASWRIKQLK